MAGEPAEVIGAGRTDAGVHAAAMVANVRLSTKLMPDEIRDYLNHYLPDDIAVDEVKTAADGFHARYKAVGKLYTYTCHVGSVKLCSMTTARTSSMMVNTMTVSCLPPPCSWWCSWLCSW